jgi:hypothetical protein
MSKPTEEQRLSAEAYYQGLLLIKARTHNKQARNYCRYVLVEDRAGNRRPGAQAVWKAFRAGGLTLEEVAMELGEVGGAR